MALETGLSVEAGIVLIQESLLIIKRYRIADSIFIGPKVKEKI